MVEHGGIVALVLAIPVMGYVSDRVGRKPLLLTCSIGFAVLAYPIFVRYRVGVELGGDPADADFRQPADRVLFRAGAGAIAEIFPTRARALWMSVGYSFSVAIFGGFAPPIATWLIANTGSPLSPSLYVIGTAVVSSLVIWRLKETAHSPLR